MRLTLAFTLTLSVAPLTAQPAPAPTGWTVSHSAHARTDASRRGTLTSAPTTTQHGIVQLGYRDRQGAQWIALYAASPQPSIIVTNLPVSAATTYVRTAGTIVGSLSPVGSVSPPSNFTVLHEGRGQTTATGYAYIESVDLLLNDGWAYLGLTTPPEYLDEAASKQREPTKWHHWKSEGNAVLIETGGQWTKLDAERVRPLPPGAALNVTLTHRNSTSFGGMGSYNTSGTITLAATGRYERSAGVIAGTGTVQAGGGFSGGAGSFQNQSERRSAVSGSNGTVTTTARSRGQGDPNLAGTYKVTGYTLELDGAGGSVQRVLVFYPFPDNDRVYIDGVTYNRDRR